MNHKFTETYRKKAKKIGYTERDIEMCGEFWNEVEIMHITKVYFTRIDFEEHWKGLSKSEGKKLVGSKEFFNAMVMASKGNTIEIEMTDGSRVNFSRGLTDEECELWMDYRLNVVR